MASTAPETHAPQWPLHDEVFLGLKPLTNIMQIHGLFPTDKKLVHNVKDPKTISKNRWLFLSFVTFCGISSVWYSIITDYAAYIADPVEGIVLSINTTSTCLVSIINLFAMVAQGSQWAAYFEQWKRLDSLLGITKDAKFRGYVRRVSIAYGVYFLASLWAALYAVIQKFLSPDGDYTGNGFAVGLIGFSLFVTCSQLLPEILFSCLLNAISTRFSILTAKIQQLAASRSSGSDKVEITHELEKSRIAFHNLMAIVRSTDAFIGPVLASCVFVTTTYLSSTVFIVFFQSLDNLGLVLSKLVYSSVALCRLMYMCFSCDSVNQKMKKLKRAIYLIPSDHVSLSRKSFDELMIFVQCTKKTLVSFTAWRFFIINKELFNKVVGAIMTYTLTILEFYGKQNSDFIFTDCAD